MSLEQRRGTLAIDSTWRFSTLERDEITAGIPALHQVIGEGETRAVVIEVA
jgi:hypothetical protein